MAKTPWFYHNKQSFINCANEAFNNKNTAKDSGKIAEMLIANFNNSVKSLDRFILFGYALAFALYFFKIKIFDIDSIGIGKIKDKDFIEIFYFIPVGICNFLACLCYYFSDKLFKVLKSLSENSKHEFFNKKFYVYILNFSSFTLVCESSRYWNYSILHKIRHALVCVIFWIYLFGPMLVLGLTNAIMYRIIYKGMYISYAALGGVVAVSLLYIIFSDAFDNDKTKQ